MAGSVAPIPRGEDPLRDQLLDAATRVFAAKGYAGTKVMDIVREAGLSSGAMYGRFASKHELLREAVVTAALHGGEIAPSGSTVADTLTELVAEGNPTLADDEAVRLEAHIAARREPEVAAAIAEALRRRRAAVQPLVEQAMAAGEVAPDSDVASILHLLDTLHLGALLQRAAGITPPDGEHWEALIRRVVTATFRS